MNSNSFLIKGWTITLVSALFALAAKESNLKFAIISYIVIPVFWILDGFYISQEKQYRKLYEEITVLEEEKINFTMDASIYNSVDSTWLNGIFSKTLIPFYGISILITLLIMFIIQ